MSAFPGLPTITLEWYPTVKQFFDAHPEIPIEPLGELWQWGGGSGCDCLHRARDCNHLKSVSEDEFSMIQVIVWNFGNGASEDHDPSAQRSGVLIDVFSYPGDNQSGYIYYNNQPIILNSDMSLYPINGYNDTTNLNNFHRIRDAAFGNYLSFDNNGKVDKYFAFSDLDEEGEGVEIPSWMFEMEERYNTASDALRNRLQSIF